MSVPRPSIVCHLSFVCLTAIACGGLPEKEVPAGSCMQSADCSDMACKNYQCVPCTAHSECASLVCDTYGDLMSPGKCVPESKLIYVNSDDPACKMGTGTLLSPVCDIADAVPKLLAPGKYVRVLASGTGYILPLIDKNSGHVVLIGPGNFVMGKAATLVDSWIPDKTGPGLVLAGQIYLGPSPDLTLDGFFIIGSGLSFMPSIMTMPGVMGGKVTIRRSKISYLDKGVSFQNGSLTLDRVAYVGNFNHLQFSMMADVRITNSIFADNKLPDSTPHLIDFSDGGTGLFEFNTVYGNTRGMNGNTLNCVTTTTVSFKNSILASNGAAPQIAGACQTVANSLVVGKADTAANQIKQDPRFVDPTMQDFRLQPGDAVNQQYLIDKAVQVDTKADPYANHDYLGNQRPQRNGYDIGAFEVTP